MSLAEPLHLLALLGLVAVAALWALAHRRRRRFAVRHPGLATLAAAVPRPARWRRVLPPALLAAAAVALSVAFAKPERTVDVPVEKASVVMVTDESGSMLADDVAPSRLDAAKAAARSFLDEAPDELLVGFASFSTSVRTNVSPTTTHDQVADAVDGLRAEGGTATGDALTAALDQLAARKGKGADGERAPSAIVLLSDGKTTAGSDPLEAAARAKKLGIPVYTVALGTDSGVVSLPDGQSVPVPPDPQTLARIAETSGGKAYSAADADTLDGVYRDLGSKIGTRQEQREVTVAFVGGGLVLLLAGLGSGIRFRGRLA